MIRALQRSLWLALLCAVGAGAWVFFDLPDTSILRKQNPKTSAIRAFREKQAREKGRRPRSQMAWRGLDEISPYLVHAVLLSEDDTFFQHHGFDIAQTKRAMQINWERKRFAFGASTLTQQLARTLYLSPSKNLLRKAREALITRRLEKTLPKKRILELYLNLVEWGPEVYGAEAASQHFFGKPALYLTPDEAIALACILPSPRRWSPTGETRFMVRRRAVLYDRMVRAHYIPPAIPIVLPGLDPGLQDATPTMEPQDLPEDEETDIAPSDAPLAPPENVPN